MAEIEMPGGVIVEAIAICSADRCVERRRYGSAAASPDEVETVAKSFPAWLVGAGWKWKPDGRGGWRLLCPKHLAAEARAEAVDVE